jgi:hypothetical protein
MTLDELNNISWITPWEPVRPKMRHGAESNLDKEVGPGHQLYKLRAVAIAHRTDNDDVLFFLPDGSKPLAVVHLTWSLTAHDSRYYTPDFPWTVLYSSREEWVETCMKRDHEEYSGPYEPTS